jgi:hypothetical protein
MALVFLSEWTTASAQESTLVQQAADAYQRLDYPAAIVSIRRALATRLTVDDRITAYELLAFSYGAVDSARQAVDAFRELIFLDPDREPDPNTVSPRITSLYASALGQVLVVRHIRTDTVSFVAGDGDAVVEFELSRPALVVARAVGPGIDVVLDSMSVAGAGRVRWPATTPTGEPAPPGIYQIILAAGSGREEYAGQVLVEVRHRPVDTLLHLTALPDAVELPETVIPPRTWRPLGLATLYTAVGAGAALALENTSLGTGARRELVMVSAATLLTGFVMSLRRPAPEPVPGNILYNQLLREELGRRNAEITRTNVERRSQTLLTVLPADEGPE